MEPTLTLFELNALVRQVIEQTMAREYWVEAELSECRESRGHCYMELIEKDEQTATPVARASAKCWRTQWLMLQPYFERTTGQQLHAGMKVKLKVYPQFHEAFGFSWIVTDIDPTFTLGDMARKRQDIIRQLKQEGVFDLQKELCLPTFCQRIAVVSSQTAAGYGDFVNQLAGNELGLQFTTQLFPAIMQGEQVEQSIIGALNRIYGMIDNFDCVVIIRGGGGTSDLSGFDTLALAENVAQFPLPIITGIGHDRDESVLDMVSFQRVKTPTAAAQLLIDNLALVLHRIEDCELRITRSAQSQMASAKLLLTAIATRIPTLFSVVRTRQEARLERMAQTLMNALQRQTEREANRQERLAAQLMTAIGQRLVRENHRMELLEQRARNLDPQLILNRGYSITLFGGKAMSQACQLQPGDEIETRLKQGIIKSIVK
ncbi:MAG: exodeoxyribonuclease VII large subunit [Prevotella sp.]|nr:exodeoxyribonuclease VII large subunit [Prevotella sp.]